MLEEEEFYLERGSYFEVILCKAIPVLAWTGP
jgi:hypothetical protein